ncbi:hypothetical protein H0176_23715 [Methylorubrum populi]|jgi:hypothetical protein|uniref:Uncharacterized protein n=1 Tax=Methylorubrum rhodesianum TaxID=29427 RepID=A0ABU9ZDQ8_9HYPH|nr:hypothetical protein [Methylorubrum rhodesianum]MBK3406254.1 hypothetical protein [Methylorubrum rhodesianum]MBY0143252.1 hypothetical protein [Methylorubrum populi]
MGSSLRRRRYSADHDDHCLITAHGLNWRITGMIRGSVLALSELDRPENGALLDISAVNFETYCAEAAAWLAPDLLISNAGGDRV